MPEVKLKRRRAFELLDCLSVCALLEVPSKFRYGAERNFEVLVPDKKATMKTYPEPDISEYNKRLEEIDPASMNGDASKAVEELKAEFADRLSEHAKWKEELNAHLDEEVKYNLYMVDLPEINDTVNFPKPGPARNRQNAALVAGLMPIIKEPT